MLSILSIRSVYPCANPEGEQGVRTPLPPPSEKSQNIGFPSNTGPDPLKLHNLPSQHSLLLIVVCFRVDEGPPPINLKHTQIHTIGKSGPSLTKLSGSAHVSDVAHTYYVCCKYSTALQITNTMRPGHTATTGASADDRGDNIVMNDR